MNYSRNTDEEYDKKDDVFDIDNGLGPSQEKSKNSSYCKDQ